MLLPARTHALRGAVKPFVSGRLSQLVWQRCATVAKRLARDRDLVRRARLPTPREPTAPWKGQSPPSGLRSLPSVALWLVIDLRPEGVAAGCSGPRHPGVAEARWPW